jgi:anti-sigma factor RsiW
MNTTNRALFSGTLASVMAALALAACARREGRRASQPMNATSHWLHGDRAASRRRIGLSHTGIGFGTHHAAAVMWAALFEGFRWQAKSNSAAAVVRDAVATSAVAAAVDYTVTPHRFTPGWELVLSKQSWHWPTPRWWPGL